MKIRLTFMLLLGIAYSGVAQTKTQTIETINQILTKAIGKTDSLNFNGKTKKFTLLSNSFSMEKGSKLAKFSSVKTFDGEQSKKTTNTSLISDWQGFKVAAVSANDGLKSIYPVFQKLDKEPDNDKNGIRYYCLAGDEDKLIAALMHLHNLYVSK